MKAIYLNIWAGKVYEPLMKYLRDESRDTDFFCLQEVFDSPLARTVSWGGRADILSHLQNALPDFISHYAVAVKNYDGDEYTDFELSHGDAIFSKKDITIASHGDFFISGEEMPLQGGPKIFPHKLQYVRFEKDGVLYTLANVHGIAFPGSKLDTSDRLAQSQKIADFLKDEQREKILGGDFNLMPDTESIRMIERAGPVRGKTPAASAAPLVRASNGAGMRNLIKEYGITDTRGAIAHERYPTSDRQYFADYAFVASGIRVINFTVPQVEISDHLPLILECV